MSYSMSLRQLPKQVQNLKQTQRLIMSSQMQQAIHLLQMPIMELSALIEEEIEQNPLLEHALEEKEDDPDLNSLDEETSELSQESDRNPEKELEFEEHQFEIMRQLDEEFRDYFNESNGPIKRNSEEEKRKAYLENSISSEASLFEHLMEQAEQTFDSYGLQIAEIIIGNFDEFGFLQTPLEEIALVNNFDNQKVERILEEIQNFEPFGVGARNLQESLLIQLRCHGKQNTLAYEIVNKHYEDLLHNRIPAIKKRLHVTSEEIEEALNKCIARLDLHPGTVYSKKPVQYIVPDVAIQQEGDKLIVSGNQEAQPSFRLNSKYLRMLNDETLAEETKEFIRHKLISAKWLMRNIYQRNDTIEKIAQSLVKHQKEFFINPEGKLTPLTMKLVAEELGLHESTIARAVSNKYLDCSRGLLPMRSFFTNAYMTESGEDISSQTVRDALLEIINNEDKHKPLSDEAISKKIQEKGIHCARRTVAKHRAALQIGNAQQRKKF